MRLFLDDRRTPPEPDWVLVRSSADAIAWCTAHGVPAHISFDHDLGGEDTAMRFAHWLVQRDLDAPGTGFPDGFTYAIHSANPVGVLNLRGLLDGYLRQR
jgi:hypothetical protein